MFSSYLCIECSSLIVAEWCLYVLATYVNTGSDNGLLSGWCQAINWTNAEILLIGPLGSFNRNSLQWNRNWKFT